MAHGLFDSLELSRFGLRRPRPHSAGDNAPSGPTVPDHDGLIGSEGSPGGCKAEYGAPGPEMDDRGRHTEPEPDGRAEHDARGPPYPSREGSGLGAAENGELGAR